MNESIILEHVSKSFDLFHENNTFFDLIQKFTQRKSSKEKIKVLDDVSFSVKKGEVFGIMGDNGSGKTSILKLISRIYQPDTGTVSSQGVVVPLLQLGVGFQPELTAYDNIMTYGTLLGFSKNILKQKMDDIVHYAGLEKYMDVKIKHFSSGMISRLSFSTAIQVDPDIILVDEVLAVGDLAFQEKGMRTFEEFKEQKKTILFVSHDPSQIMRICDRVIILKQGKVHDIGEPSSVVERYMKESLSNK